MENFTPVSALIGGIIIGLAAVGLLYFNRQICGVSGIVGACVPPVDHDSGWRFSFIGGLLCGGAIVNFAYPPAFEFSLHYSASYLILGGLLVGFGTRYGKGCTSGHGVCGVGRLAPRSIIATAIYMIVAVITRTIITHFGV